MNASAGGIPFVTFVEADGYQFHPRENGKKKLNG
jgi:hypothetical protein